MRNDIIDSIKKTFWEGSESKEVVLAGKTWTLKSLNNSEQVFRDRFIPASATASFLSARKAPTVALAISHIDGVPVEEVFGDSDETKDEVVTELLKTTGLAKEKRFIIAERVLEFLNELPPEVVDTLYGE